MITVRELMTPAPITLRARQPLPRAQELMALERIRHLPVIDDQGKLVGLLSHRDILRGIASGLPLRAEDLMQRSVRTIEPQASALDAAEALLAHQVGCLPVVEDERLIGIVTESDFVRWSARELGSAH